MPPTPSSDQKPQDVIVQGRPTKQQAKGSKRKFRLLAGMHIGDDGAHHEKGAIVESTLDLTATFGPEKFQALQPLSEEEREQQGGGGNVAATSFPAGQVHSGLQATTTLPSGDRVSGPAESIQESVDNSAVPVEDSSKTSSDPKKASAAAAKAQQAKASPKEVSKAQEKAPPPSTSSSSQQSGKKGTENSKDSKGAESSEGETEEVDLNSRTVEELKQLAEEEEIDLKGAKTKAEIIKAIEEG